MAVSAAITGTPFLASAPTAYSGTNSSQLTPAIQTLWSKEILFQAMPTLRFEQFAIKKTELGVQPGTTVNFMRYNNLGAAVYDSLRSADRDSGGVGADGVG